MRFLPPDNPDIPHSTGKISSQYAKLKIPHFKGWMTEGEFGVVISQSFKAIDYEVWQHHFFVKQPCLLNAHAQIEKLALAYMLEGSPAIQLPSGEIKLTENCYQLFYVPIMVQPVNFEPGNYHCVHLNYDPEYARYIANRSPQLSKIIARATQARNQIIPYSGGLMGPDEKAGIKGMLRKRPKKLIEVSLRNNILQLFFIYMERHLSGFMHSFDLEFLIETNLKVTMNVDDLGKEFGKSRSDLFRWFEEMYKESPINFIRKKKLDTAMEYLLTTEKSIGEIAASVGYNELSAFIKAFKRQFGKPPSSFR